MHGVVNVPVQVVAQPANPIAYQAEEEAGAPDVDDNNGEAVPASAFARAGHIATAFFLLLLTDVILRTRGFSGLCWFMGRWPTRVRTASRDAVPRTQLSEALRLASACYFRHAWCLQRAAALTCLLRFMEYRPMSSSGVDGSHSRHTRGRKRSAPS